MYQPSPYTPSPLRLREAAQAVLQGEGPEEELVAQELALLLREFSIPAASSDAAGIARRLRAAVEQEFRLLLC